MPTSRHALPLPTDGQSPWGQDVRDALETIDAALGRSHAAGYLLVRTAADLPAASGGEHLLPANTLVELAGTIDLGANALRMSVGTVLRGLAGDTIMSSADGVVRCTGLASAVVMREFNIVATGGRCLDLAGPIDQQLNVFFVGLIGAAPGTSAGTISGFDVQAIKDCYINAPQGLTHTGTTNKVFVSQTPFYGITGSGITFAAALNVGVIDITHPFFKYNAPGTAITAEPGYTLGRGVLVGTLFDGTLTRLNGLSPADPKWDMHSNPGMRDSAAIGAYVQNTTGQQVTPILAVDTPVKAVVTTVPSAFNERFDHNTNGTLTCRTLDAGTFVATATGNISSVANNQTVRMWVAKNGVPLTTAVARAVLGGGGDIDAVTAAGVLELVDGDTVDIYVENLTSSGNITLVDSSLSVARTA